MGKACAHLLAVQLPRLVGDDLTVSLPPRRRPSA